MNKTEIIETLKELIEATEELNGEFQSGWDDTIVKGREVVTALENKVLLPKSLTFENGAKNLLRGEFVEAFTVEEIDEDEKIVTFEKHVPVTWITVKDIYKKIVKYYTNES